MESLEGVRGQVRGDIVFTETVSKYLIGKRCSLRVLKAIQWASRLGYIVCIYAMIVFVAHPEDSAGIYGIIGAFLIALGLILLIYQTEFLNARTLRGISPIKLYKNGLFLKRYPLGFLVGRGGFIRADQIDHLQILRGTVEQKTAPKEGIVWRNAMSEIIIFRKGGKKEYTGYKIPTEIAKIIDLTRDMWNIPVVDNGTGLGTSEHWKAGQRVG